MPHNAGHHANFPGFLKFSSDDNDVGLVASVHRYINATSTVLFACSTFASASEKSSGRPRRRTRDLRSRWPPLSMCHARDHVVSLRDSEDCVEVFVANHLQHLENTHGIRRWREVEIKLQPWRTLNRCATGPTLQYHRSPPSTLKTALEDFTR